MLLTGTANLQLTPPPRLQRRVMTLPLLKLLGHKLASLDWPPTDIQTVWTVCCTGFFSSARMGELLARDELSFDPSSTLTWADIRQQDASSFLIHTRSPKSGRPGGEFMDVFPFSDSSVCPVLAMNRHRDLQQEAGLLSLDSPVFRLHSGRNLTMARLNSILHDLCRGIIDPSKESITCHSFRAAVASALARFPDLASAEDIKGWGRWSSNAYLHYTRLSLEQKKAIFSKISKALCTPPSKVGSLHTPPQGILFVLAQAAGICILCSVFGTNSILVQVPQPGSQQMPCSRQ
jgi:hypothetical protein